MVPCWRVFLHFLVFFRVLYFVMCDHESPITAVAQKALEKTTKSCMVKVNATVEDMEYLREDPPFPEKAACIVKCLLEKIGIVKRDRFSKNGFMAVLLPLVLRNKNKLEHMRQVSESCDKEVNHEESKTCQLGNEVASCILKYAPELHYRKHT